MVNIVSRRTALMVLGAVLLALGAGSNITLRRLYDTRPAYVNVRWAASADEGARQRLEERYGLTNGEFREQRTWGYYLTDQSRANIEALVRDPMVEDTFHINRRRMRLDLGAARDPSLPPNPEIPRMYELLSLGTLVAGAAVFGFAVVLRLSRRRDAPSLPPARPDGYVCGRRVFSPIREAHVSPSQSTGAGGEDRARSPRGAATRRPA